MVSTIWRRRHSTVAREGARSFLTPSSIILWSTATLHQSPSHEMSVTGDETARSGGNDEKSTTTTGTDVIAVAVQGATVETAMTGATSPNGESAVVVAALGAVTIAGTAVEIDTGEMIETGGARIQVQVLGSES